MLNHHNIEKEYIYKKIIILSINYLLKNIKVEKILFSFFRFIH